MLRTPCLLATVALALFVTRARAADDTLWQFRDGRWQQAAAPTTRPAPDPILNECDAFIAAGRVSEAHRILHEWERDRKGDPNRDRCLYLLAVCDFREGQRMTAFFQLDELLDTYPDSPLFQSALQIQYVIADAYLGGYRDSLLGLRLLSDDDRAVDMMYRIQSRSPGSPLAERALLRTADYYYFNQSYDLSADAYAAFVRMFPRSDSVPRARLRQAFSNWAQFRGPRFDPTPLIDARAELVSIIHDLPELGRQENLPDMLTRIDRTMARKSLVTADFYARTRQPRAAAYALQYVLDVYPQFPEADDARKQLAALPPDARADAAAHPLSSELNEPRSTSLNTPVGAPSPSENTSINGNGTGSSGREVAPGTGGTNSNGGGTNAAPAAGAQPGVQP